MCCLSEAQNPVQATSKSGDAKESQGAARGWLSVALRGSTLPNVNVGLLFWRPLNA